ncbi:MAG: nucleoside transporter C-terminal domain-containing protein, partial [Pseudomonadota bacterium]
RGESAGMEAYIENARSFLGIFFVLLLAWGVSSSRRTVPYRTVCVALIIQAGIGVLVFTVPGLQDGLASVTGVVGALQAATLEGTQFAFGHLAGGAAPYDVTQPANSFIIVFQVLPMILVVSTLAAITWHWGILESICRGIGFLFKRVLNLSGPAGLGAAASVFLGMVETPMVIRPYLNRLSRADVLLVMSAAMATVAGTMMAVYIALLLPRVPDAGAHIIAASFMSAPGAIAITRILEPPEQGARQFEEQKLPKFYQSTMDAFIRGVQEGLNVFLSVIAMIIVSVAIIALIDNTLAAFAPMVGGEALSAGRILGWVFSPIMFAIGIPWADCPEAGRLLATKLMLNEFLAFLDLVGIPEGAIEPRSRLIMIYVLCGFANFAALAIMIGGMSAMCPDRRDDFMQLGLKALLGGFLANTMSGAIVGTLF